MQDIRRSNKTKWYETTKYYFFDVSRSISPLGVRENSQFCIARNNFHFAFRRHFLIFQFFVKSKVYALDVYVWKICGNFEVNQFTQYSWRNLGHQLQRHNCEKNTFKVLGIWHFRTKKIFFNISLYSYIINVPSCKAYYRYVAEFLQKKISEYILKRPKEKSFLKTDRSSSGNRDISRVTANLRLSFS